MDLVAQHCSELARRRIDGTMLSWSLGGYPSPNLRIARRFAENPQSRVDTVLDDLAREIYAPDGAVHARRGWTAMSRAFAEFPYDGAVVYNAPQQFGPANLLYGRATGFHWTMIGFPYDDVNGWRGPYPADVSAAQFEKVAAGWAEGLTSLGKAVDATPAATRAQAESELRIARAGSRIFPYPESLRNENEVVLCVLMCKDGIMDYLPKGRLDAFADGVFALVITLLVLDLAVPEGQQTLYQVFCRNGRFFLLTS